MKPYDKIPFTNEMDDVIQPDDKVLVVTTSRKRTSIRRGVYLGSRPYKTYSGQVNDVSVIVAVEHPRNVRRHHETNVEIDWNRDQPTPDQIKAEFGVEYPGTLGAPIELQAYRPGVDSPEVAKFKDWNQKYIEFSRARIQWFDKYWPYRKEYVTRYKTLQLNRIYPINVKFERFAEAGSL